jgi:hypothetical protein
MFDIFVLNEAEDTGEDTVDWEDSVPAAVWVSDSAVVAYSWQPQAFSKSNYQPKPRL